MSRASIFFAIAGIVAFGWIGVISVRIITELLDREKEEFAAKKDYKS